MIKRGRQREIIAENNFTGRYTYYQVNILQINRLRSEDREKTKNNDKYHCHITLLILVDIV